MTGAGAQPPRNLVAHAEKAGPPSRPTPAGSNVEEPALARQNVSRGHAESMYGAKSQEQ
jgi:hypothetical protein